MSDMFSFMAKRQDAILRRDLGHNVKALSSFNQRYRYKIAEIAKDHARADKSNPFSFKRTMSHLLGGTAPMDDYSLTWGREHRRSNINPEIEFDVPMPMNMKIPCY